MPLDKVTIQYMVWDTDNIYDESLHLPITPKIGITEVLSVTFFDGKWTVMSDEPGASPEWIGRHEYKQMAILDYLKTRLGHYEEKTEDE